MVIGEGTGSYIFIPEKSSIPVNSACVISICVCLTESKRLHICQFYQVVGTQANSSKTAKLWSFGVCYKQYNALDCSYALNHKTDRTAKVTKNKHVSICLRFEPPLAPDLQVFQMTAMDAFPMAIVGFAVAYAVAKVYSVKHDYLIDGNQVSSTYNYII